MPANLPQIVFWSVTVAVAILGMILAARKVARDQAAETAKLHTEQVAREVVERSALAQGWRSEITHLEKQHDELAARVTSIEQHLRTRVRYEGER